MQVVLLQNGLDIDPILITNLNLRTLHIIKMHGTAK